MSSHARRLSAVLGALLLGVLVAAAPASALDAKRLRGQLSTLHKKLGSRSAALVVDLDSGRTIFQRRAKTSLSPASNEKLFTTAAALLEFGPHGTLTTSVVAKPGEEISRAGVIDDLVVVGGGDPSLNDVALRSLAGDLVADGLKRVRGGLLADESLFDTRRGSYDSRYRPDSDLGGWLGALTWAHGRPDYTHGPALEAAERLHAFLRAKGVKFGRKARVRALPRADRNLAVPLAQVESPPMRRLAAITNQPSDNFYAEMLLKGLGAHFGKGGTTPYGAAAARAALRRIDVRPTRLVDGSGLSRADKASPRQIIALLRAMDEQPTETRTAFFSSLAVVGRSGTLAWRMRGTAAQTRCRGKTGTLRGVSALSGYCTTTGGRRVAFAFVENDVNALRAKAVEDRMLPRIATLDP